MYGEDLGVWYLTTSLIWPKKCLWVILKVKGAGETKTSGLLTSDPRSRDLRSSQKQWPQVNSSHAPLPYPTQPVRKVGSH